MLRYLIILLDETSTSFCHYEVDRKERRLIQLDTLKQGIRFGMMENLMIQFVYPNFDLPEAYKEAIESIDHSKIMPFSNSYKGWKNDADVIIQNGFQETDVVDVPIVLRIKKLEFFANTAKVCDLLAKTPRLNIVLTDIESFMDENFEDYGYVLGKLSEELERGFIEGKPTQLNLLTDRMMLKEMNNCGAGDTTITLAPNGKFYICPAFYYEDESNFVGDVEHGLDIKNRQLYKLVYAPICRHCDAYQCKRCIWLNRKTTLEVNTPSHEQCVIAHLERNASRQLLNNIRRHGTFLPEQEEIKEIDYLDPFDKRDKWQ